MEKVILDLKDWGCDIEGAMERFIDDEELYISCLETVLDDPNFKDLGDSLEKNDVKQSFDYAHTIKGVVANMGLTPLYNQVVRVVEPLRHGRIEGVNEAYKGLMAEFENLKKIVTK